ncbi:MAG: ABC transporter permease, partial [Planctomycetota bacterium]
MLVERSVRGGGVGWGAVRAVWGREMVRFFRQRNRVIGAVATPLVFWALLGFGLDRVMVVEGGGVGGGADTAVVGDRSQATGLNGEGQDAMGEASQATAPREGAAGGVGYLAYFFPGALGLMLLFTAIFTTVSVIEDRKEGFLQGALVSPAGRWALVLGKVGGGASIAMVQGLAFLAAWPFVVGAWPSVAVVVGVLGAMLLLAVGVTGFGLALAWPMDSTAGFHAIMNLLLMPAWMLSGAVFPAETAPVVMRAVMYANPMTYGQGLLTGLMLG